MSDNEIMFRREMLPFARLMSYYKCAMMEIETKFNVLNEEFSFYFDRQPINSIKTRIKDPVSIKNKLEKRGLPFTMDAIEDNLNDIAGVRVVCSFLDDVYMLADALLKQDDIVLIEKKDYIENPKKNGYRSLHLIVGVPIFLQQEKRMMRVEIQLRTIAMDFWASLEHQLVYKKQNELTERMKLEIKYCAELSAKLDAKMDDIRKELIGDEDIDEYEDDGEETVDDISHDDNMNSDDKVINITEGETVNSALA